MKDKLKRAETLNIEVLALLEVIKNEKRDATSEEREQLKAKQAEINDLLEMVEVEKQAQKTSDYINKPLDVQDLPPAGDQEKPKFGEWGNEINSAFGDFLLAVKDAAKPGASIDPRLIKNTTGNIKTNVPDEGGFAIVEEFRGQLVRSIYETGIVVQKCQRDPIGANANGASWWDYDETSRATGSRMGGIRGYWGDEAASITLSKAKLRKLSLSLEKKLMGMCLPTFEQMQDAAFLGSRMQRDFQNEFGWLMDDAVINGPGGGRPLGIYNSPALISVAKETNQQADTIVFENILKMYSRLMISSMRNAVWYVNQFAMPQLATMGLVIGAGGVPVYLPSTGAAGSPFGTLMGLPVQPIEQCQALGDKGDIYLADMSTYQIIDKGGVQADSSIHVYFATAEEAFRFLYRVDGRPMLDSAITAADGSGNTVSPYITLAERA